jgi:hypothetical protein
MLRLAMMSSVASISTISNSWAFILVSVWLVAIDRAVHRLQIMSPQRVRQRRALHRSSWIKKVTVFNETEQINDFSSIDLGRNSIIVILGANLLLNEDDLTRAEEVIQQSKVLVCQLEIRQETVVKALQLARKHAGKHRRRE